MLETEVALSMEQVWKNVCVHINLNMNFCIIWCIGIIFNNLEDHELSYTLRLRHDTPTRALGANKWYTHIRIPGLQPTGPRVYDK